MKGDISYVPHLSRRGTFEDQRPLRLSPKPFRISMTLFENDSSLLSVSLSAHNHASTKGVSMNNSVLSRHRSRCLWAASWTRDSD